LLDFLSGEDFSFHIILLIKYIGIYHLKYICYYYWNISKRDGGLYWNHEIIRIITTVLMKLTRQGRLFITVFMRWRSIEKYLITQQARNYLGQN